MLFAAWRAGYQRGVPDLAVVMITQNRAESTLHAARRAAVLPERPCLVVVDNASTDTTTALLRSHLPEATVVALPANHASAGRNIGTRVAGCRYTAFADDDSWWAPGSLRAAIEIMDSDPSIALVSARVLVGPDESLDPVSDLMEQAALSGSPAAEHRVLRSITGCLACATVVRTAAFLAAGGFPLSLGVGGEEQIVVWDLLSAGHRAVYAPDLVVHHHPSPSRNPARREATVTRNDLWSAWSRLPLPAMAARSLRTLAPPSGPRLRGAAEAARRCGWALSRRAVLPAHVEAARRSAAAVTSRPLR